MVPSRESLFPALRVLAQSRCAGSGPAHDWLHVTRVVGNARQIARAEGANEPIAEAAALLHELFNYPKGHADSHRSGEVCAEHARRALFALGADEAFLEPVVYAIRVHPFSLGVVPDTLEGKVLQDADRLDAIGAVGVARCFATCAEMKRPFYHRDDPFCARRDPEDKLWGTDHFFKKLLKLEMGMHTRTARALAAERTAFMRAFLSQLGAEIGA